MGIETNKWGFRVGRLPHGPRNKISDVPGVTVGHCTLADGNVQTGVTALLPHPGDVFHDKVLAASHVINGFGKTTGLVQIDELGTLETPILFTNTLSVGTVETALVKYMLQRNPDICETTGSVNPVVCECNDSGLNDIRGLHVTEEHVFAALADCRADFAEGAVGAGRGMRCHGLKGGIGSASRQDIGKDMWIRRVLVPNLTNDDNELNNLYSFISSLKTVKKVEILPYHTLGIFKWENLGIKYPLEGYKPPTKEEVEKAEKILHIEK